MNNIKEIFLFVIALLFIFPVEMINKKDTEFVEQ